MNKTIRHTSVVCLLMVLALLVRATWLQAYEARALADDQYNRRKAIAQYAQPLGDIIVAGSPVTGSRRTRDGDLSYARTYPDGALYAPVTGYSSQAYGSTQLEGIYADVLDGTDSRLKSPLGAITGERTRPGDVVTTIDPAVQRAGYRALGGKKGAAVALDPSTGRVLAVVSTPSYDPTEISGTTDGDAWRKLTGDAAKPMVNRALRQPLPPGSTFKLVVAAAALEDGLYGSVDEPTASPDPYTLPATTTVLRNESASAPCADASIRTALRYSCNTVFAKMAVELGQSKVRAMAEKFGFDDTAQDMPVRASESVYPSGMDDAQTALSGIGQFDVTATPLQMAMVSSALAHDGLLAAPHMVSRVVDAAGDTLLSWPDGDSRRVVSSSTAEQLRDAMVTVVEDGTGTNARIDGAEVGGKTGTAQHGVDNSRTPYAWFTSYAKDAATGKEVAVAVVVEDSGAARSEVSGNGLAAPVARKMMTAALN
ncbi:penicillin-binding transpeptidase domain-containing protein [Streptomyces sp. AK02-01A]|uniref:penicillin-binding transpeptidase domain-containing protein n=1 Tax=Streptomyces sp. AK02-01A TaxID=3028648 RepID=UPI0029A2832E|nr:penicillin-binding transpeptidase domain-containing protein [Streptomyces sp. AK02-01A]MDX3851520.1 penicillin-binding transpeptidase domain-containing protein [Streptomyces sp. AK02-01A]